MAREIQGVDGQNFKITDKMHPRTEAVATFCIRAVAEYKEGKRKSLPTQDQISRRYPGISTDTVASIISRLELSSTFVESRKIDQDRIVDLLEEGIAKGAPPSYRQIALTLRCSIHPIFDAVRETDGLQLRLRDVRAAARKELADQAVFTKGQETAWFLGAMFSGGSLKKSYEATGLILTNPDTDVLQAFKASGEDIIGREGRESNLADRTNLSIVFRHVDYARLLAPFSFESRAQQILEDYSWVRDPKFLNSFVTGLFDAGGKAYFKGKNRRISFAASTEELADFYISTLKLFGIERPRIEGDKGKPKRVFFGTIPDLKKFSQEVQTISHDKQEVFDEITNYEATDAELRIRGNRAKHIFP